MSHKINSSLYSKRGSRLKSTFISLSERGLVKHSSKSILVYFNFKSFCSASFLISAITLLRLVTGLSVIWYFSYIFSYTFSAISKYLMSSAFSFISSSSYFFGNYVPVNVSIRNLRLFLCEKYFNKNNNIISNLLFFMSLLILYKTFPYLLTF
ncbi:hypothetical protein AB237_2298 [Acinetobacter baumannii NCGM 237]|nr:hypothetical protein AB237_2298 [Acinetobacter baumannii NCGM 237]